jgi:peptidyl-prolyl cis-trans isomerase B (cyclophilin B)
MRRLAIVLGLIGGVFVAGSSARQAKPKAAPDPVVVLETAKGTIEIRLFKSEAPKSVDHLLELMKRSFYRGQRFHRVTSALVQVGDPSSRNMSRQDSWGTSNSGNPIGVFELSKKRSHVRGAVGLAHSGNPLGADSQIYIMKTASPGLDGKHAIVGQVMTGMAVVDKIVVTDMIKNATVK